MSAEQRLRLRISDALEEIIDDRERVVTNGGYGSLGNDARESEVKEIESLRGLVILLRTTNNPLSPEVRREMRNPRRVIWVLLGSSQFTEYQSEKYQEVRDLQADFGGSITYYIGSCVWSDTLRSSTNKENQ